MKSKIRCLISLFACTMMVMFVSGLFFYSWAEQKPKSFSLEVTKGVRVIEKRMALNSLTIAEGASLAAPEGKYLTMTVYGTGKTIEPGTYMGDIVLSVTDNYVMGHVGNSKAMGDTIFHTAILIDDGKVVPEKCTPAVVYGGEVTDIKTEGIYISSEEPCFNGIVIAGDTEYTINNVKMDLDGFGTDDFIGVGSAVTAYGNSRVTINDSEFNVNGVTRCAVHVGGDSVVTLNNCKLYNHSLENPELKNESVDWQVDFSGTNRLTQLCENGTVYYNNCHLKTNGWGVCSIDGGQVVKMYVKDSILEGNGPNGYGAFVYGNNPITFDHSTVNVNGYPMFVQGKQGRGEIINGCLIKGRRFGVMFCGDDNSVVNIKDSTFQTGKSTLCIKGSATTINIDNTVMNPKNGVIVQLMDSDEDAGLSDFKIPVGIVDVALPDRDLTTVHPMEDIKMNIANSDIQGNFFNSTTNIRATESSTSGGMMGMMGEGRGAGAAPEGRGAGAAPEGRGAGAGPGGAGPGGAVDLTMRGGTGTDLRGPKNLSLNLTNARIKGVISSATQAYREGLTVIVPKTKHDLSNVTQTAAEPVNNGVILSLDEKSVWTVTGTSYITSLTIAEGGLVIAPMGMTLTMTVDGVQTPVKTGTYKGKIVIKVS